MKHLTLVSQYGFLDHELLENVAKSFRHLESIDLGGNGEADSEAFKPLSSLLHLRTLKLAFCESLPYEVFNGFASGLSSLTHIDISGVQFPGTSVGSFGCVAFVIDPTCIHTNQKQLDLYKLVIIRICRNWKRL
jgi:hypothetical protein